MTAAEAARQADDGEDILLDVRSVLEWAAGHAPAARNLPLDQLDPAALDPGHPVITVCPSGMRSMAAARRLTKAGVDARSLADGMRDYLARSGTAGAGRGK